MEWIDIVGYEGLYQVNKLGEVKSLNFNHTGKPRLLKTRVEKSGYETVGLFKQGEKKWLKIHRLIAIHFIPNPQNKPQVNHINGIRHDNNIANLEWVTCKENHAHAFELGLRRGKRGEDSHYSKLVEKDVLDMRKLKKFFTTRELSTIFGVSTSQVKRIVKRENWSHI